MVIPGHKNIDVRNILWVEPGGIKKVQSNSLNPLYYAREKNGKVLVKKRRLVTTGLNGMVIEWNLNTCLPKSKYNAHGAVWDSKVQGKFVFLASEDGSIKIVKIKKTKIEIIKMLTKSSTSCLSLALVEGHKPAKKQKESKSSKKDGSESESDNVSDDELDVGGISFVFAGYADGTLKKWNVQSSNSVMHIEKQTAKETKKNGPCFIWKLRIFGQFLISGDSKGEDSVWDLNFGTLVK